MLSDTLLYYRNAKRYLKLLEKQNDKRSLNEMGRHLHSFKDRLEAYQEKLM